MLPIAWREYLDWDAYSSVAYKCRKKEKIILKKPEKGSDFPAQDNRDRYMLIYW